MNWLKRKHIEKYKQSEAFKKDALDFAYKQQGRGDWRDKCEVAYTDSEGRQYYRFTQEDQDLPHARFNRLALHQRELTEKFTQKDGENFIENVEALIEKAKENVRTIKQNPADSEKVIDAVGKWQEHLGYWKRFAEGFKTRFEIAVDPDVLLRMFAAVCIREDENPYEVSDEIEEQKFNQFKNDSKGAVGSWFKKKGLKQYIALSAEPESKLNKRLELTLSALKTIRDGEKEIKETLAQT